MERAGCRPPGRAPLRRRGPRQGAQPPEEARQGPAQDRSAHPPPGADRRQEAALRGGILRRPVPQGQGAAAAEVVRERPVRPAGPPRRPQRHRDCAKPAARTLGRHRPDDAGDGRGARGRLAQSCGRREERTPRREAVLALSGKDRGDGAGQEAALGGRPRPCPAPKRRERALIARITDPSRRPREGESATSTMCRTPMLPERVRMAAGRNFFESNFPPLNLR